MAIERTSNNRNQTSRARRRQRAPRHKIFVSFHDANMEEKDRFLNLIDGHAVDKSVHDDDIDDTNSRVARVRQRIRDDFIADATVTVVLIGTNTWQRKHVDWEIGASVSKTENNDRCGLLGILLPSHPNHNARSIRSSLLPPRLVDNLQGEDPYAKLYKLPDNPSALQLRQWIHDAYLRRRGHPPNNSRLPFGNNRSGGWATGWQPSNRIPERIYFAETG